MLISYFCDGYTLEILDTDFKETIVLSGGYIPTSTKIQKIVALYKKRGLNYSRAYAGSLLYLYKEKIMRRTLLVYNKDIHLTPNELRCARRWLQMKGQYDGHNNTVDDTDSRFIDED